AGRPLIFITVLLASPPRIIHRESRPFMISGATFSQIISGLGLVAAAAIVSSTLIVLLQPLLQSYALARPNARSSHTVPTPQGGGISVVIATLGITIGGTLFDPILLKSLYTPLAGALLVAIVGVVDDLRPLGVLSRLLLQLVA